MQRSLAVLVPVLVAALAPAQDFWFPMGFANTAGPPNFNAPVARAKDANFDGVITVPGELSAGMLGGFPDPTGTNAGKMHLPDGAYVVENGELAWYWADTETGDVIRGQDLDHDGLLAQGELTEFFTFGRRTNGAFLGSPDTVAAWRDPATGQTRVYATLQNYTASTLPVAAGIYRLVDLNNDGDAMDAGESSPFVGTSLGLTVPGNSGPVPIDSQFWDRLRVLPGGKLIAWADGVTLQPPYTVQPGMNAFYGFTDNNGVAVPEVWLNLSTLNDLPLHPDFANATFPNMDIQRTGGTDRDNLVRFLDVVPPVAPGAPSTYYIGSSYNAGFDTNLNGQIVSGLFYRVWDLDNDQTIDQGELTLFANISGFPVAGVQPITVTDIGNQTTIAQLGGATERPWGMAASPDGALHFLFQRNGGSVITMKDLDFNGVIDQGEAVMTFTLAGFGGTNWPYPFDSSTTAPSSSGTGPYWDGIVAPGDGAMPGPFPAGVTTIGDGCTAPSRGLKPVMDVFGGAPQIGNLAFQVGSIRGVVGMPALMVVGFTATPAGVPLASVGLPAGCNLYVANPVVLGLTFHDGAGRAPFAVPLPNNPQFIGGQLVFQDAILDPLSPAAIQYHTSNALQVTIQP